MRYSSHAQDDGFSIEAQEKAIKKYADEHGYDLQYYYCDKAKTGTNSKRPEFQKMIADSKKKLFQVCIVHKTDRFARSRYDSIFFKSIIKKSGVELLSVTENFGNDPEGKVMEGIAEVFAEYYSNNLAREVKKGLDVIASQGLHTGGLPPLGYDVSEKRLVINESEAEIVRLIFDRYSNGYTYNDIAKELNAKGYKTKIEGSQSMYSSYRCSKKQNHKIGCGNSEIEKNRLETFVLEQMQKYLFSDNAIKTIVKQVNEYNISVSKSKNSDLVLYEKQLNEINKQIKNITLAIAKGVNQELMINK